MDNESAITHNRTLKELGYIFPWAGLVSTFGSILMYYFGGDHLVWLAYVLGGAGVGLGIAYFILSIIRAHSRSGGHTAISLILAILLMASAGFAIYAENFVANFSIFGPPKPPTLAQSLQNAATSASGPAGAFLKSGKSGSLLGTNWPDSHWTNPKGGQIPIGVSWTRNSKGILITASPGGKVPKGQDGTPRTQQVLTNGMLEFPLDYFEQQGKKMQSSTFDLFSPELFMFNDLVQASAKPIIDYAKGHDGALPEKAEGATLLSTVKKVFDCTPDPTSPSRFMRVEITKYTYRPLADGIFSIDYDWECSQPNDPPKGNPDFKARGTSSIFYTAQGKIAIKTGEKNNPIAQFLMSIEQQGGEEEARERKAAKAAQKERPATSK